MSVFLGVILITGVKIRLTPKTYVTYSRVLIKRASVFLGRGELVEETFGIETNCEILRSKGFMRKVIDYMKEQGMKIGFLNLANAPDILLEITTITPLRNSDIIQIGVVGENPEEIATICNSITETFKNYSVKIARAKVTEIKKFIENQLPEAEGMLRNAEMDLQAFKEREKLISVSAGGEILQEQFAELQAEYNALLSEIDVNEKSTVYLKEELKRENERLVEEIVKVGNPSISNLRNQLLQLERERSSYILAGMSEDHAKLVSLEEKIKVVKQALTDVIKNRSADETILIDPLSYSEELSRKILNKRSELLTLQIKKEVLGERIEKQKVRVRRFPAKEYELAGFQRVYEFNANIYKRLVDRYEEAKITEMGEIGNVVIVEHAKPPNIPISPKPKRSMTLALIFGLGLGIGAVLFKEYLDTSLKDAEDIKRLDIPIIGAIPIHTQGIIEDQLSPAAETYKKLRINLKFSKSGDTKLKTLLVSSCIAKEGKSTFVCNLAITYAKAGVKTIILGADLRKPNIYKILRVTSKFGLSNLLIGEVKKEDVILPTEINNLWVIPAGHIPPNPGEIIDSQTMQTLFSELRESFDMVIVDSPPLIVCADGLLLGNMVDGVVLVVELGRAQKDEVLQTISNFKSTGASFLGVVINKVKKGIYYRYHYYYKYYTPKSI
ncbi:polysaccharide biosynthesis tyrosine autokinase [candidate division WOR-3 bacterium]|nr:polysaccharide biosynthesis tyrosine autokinase [candidate division WOR-3 bacterium]